MLLFSWKTKTGIAKGVIKEIYRDGIVPNLPIEISASADRPIALIEVWRNGKPSKDLVGVPCDKLSPADLLRFNYPDEDEEEEGYEITYPEVTPEQLDKINKFCGEAVGLGRISAREITTLSFVAADNLLNRGLGKWGVAELKQLAKLAPGNQLTLNHDWENVEKSQGLIYDARVIKADNDDPAIDAAGNSKVNREIVANEGHYQMVIDVAFEKYSGILDRIRFGKVGKVSCGGFAYRDTWCPLCNTSFNDEKCPHGMPMPWFGLTAETNEFIAPYYIRKDVYDLGEVSLVLIPNLPNAGIVRKNS